MYNDDSSQFLPASELSPLGHTIRKYREKYKLSQQALADACGFSVSTLKRIIAGKVSINLDTAIKLADELHISLDELAGRPGFQIDPSARDRIHELEIKVLEQEKTIALQEKELAVKDSHIEDLTSAAAKRDETISAQRRSNRRYQIFTMVVLAILLIVTLYDIFDGRVGYVRYAIPSVNWVNQISTLFDRY